MTPLEYSCWVKGYEKKEEETRKKMYDLAVLIRMANNSKHMPKYEQVYKARKKKTMSDEDMYAMAKALNRMMGGVEK